jgi:insulysin
VGTDEVRRNALAELLVQLTKREAFAQLRTREQLGYIVSLFSAKDSGVYSLQLVVQSSSHSAEHIRGRAETFVQAMAR